MTIASAALALLLAGPCSAGPAPSVSALGQLQAAAGVEASLSYPQPRALFVLRRAAPHGAPAGAWEVRRAGDEATAAAFAGANSSIRSLARQIGLNAAEWKYWLTVPPETSEPADVDAILPPGTAFRVPNTISALWLGERGKFGKAVVSWPGDLRYLRARGFLVVEWDEYKDDLLSGVFAEPSRRRELFGVMVTGHGNQYSFSNKSDSRSFSYQEISTKLRYRLGFGIFNVCEGDSAQRLMSEASAFYGLVGLMLPVFQTGHPWAILAPGDFATN